MMYVDVDKDPWAKYCHVYVDDGKTFDWIYASEALGIVRKKQPTTLINMTWTFGQTGGTVSSSSNSSSSELKGNVRIDIDSDAPPWAYWAYLARKEGRG